MSPAEQLSLGTALCSVGSMTNFNYLFCLADVKRVLLANNLSRWFLCNFIFCAGKHGLLWVWLVLVTCLVMNPCETMRTTIQEARPKPARSLSRWMEWGLQYLPRVSGRKVPNLWSFGSCSTCVHVNSAWPFFAILFSNFCSSLCLSKTIPIIYCNTQEPELARKKNYLVICWSQDWP